VTASIASVEAELAELERQGLSRRLRAIDRDAARRLTIDGRAATNFSSNDYLGLADHPVVVRAAVDAVDRFGFGAGASRLISGNLPPHRQLERAVERWQATDTALVLNSGYQANVGVVSTLAGPDDVVFSDALNHASLIDGCRLSRARVEVYRHLEVGDLVARLRQATGRRRLVLTEAIFSMDGDRAPLQELVEVARAHDALLIVDQAHAVGVVGPSGAGLGHDLPIDLRIGTFGKALGGFGAFAAGRAPLVKLLMQRARSFVFTTALPVPVVAAAEAAVAWLATPEGAERRHRLASASARVRAALRQLGLATPAAAEHIIPLRVAGGGPVEALAVTELLLERGLYVQAIRPPTVPAGTSRLRLSLTATHTEDELRRLIDALSELRRHFV
jgi:8-amino-7-oxononanoate synthase